MGSESPPKLPVIDFSNLKPSTPEWDLVKDQVQQALEEFGCFEALFNEVLVDLRKEVLGAIEEIFDLPLQTKLRNISKKPFHGYVGQYPMIPLYESMGIDDANIPEKVESMTNILWPQGNPSFSNTIQSFSEQVSELDQMVRRMVLESLGVEKYLDEHMDSTNYLLRVMKYKGPQTSETKLGLTSHTDKHMVTILYQNEVEGLEVQTKDGEWINYKPSSDSFIVMIGDSLHNIVTILYQNEVEGSEFQTKDGERIHYKASSDSFIVMIGDSLFAWTNGRVHAANHRVMMSGNEARYSVGLFSIPKAGYMIKAPEELVDEEHPLLFKPFDPFEFLAFFYTEEGQRVESALKTYCGV